MGHVYTKVKVLGTKTHRELESLLVDTGATFTVLPRELLEDVGASKLPMKRKLQLGDGRSVEADVYAVVIGIGEHDGPTVVVTFTGAQPVLGVRSLEDLGLKVDPVRGMLEPTRPPGVAYYYSISG